MDVDVATIGYLPANWLHWCVCSVNFEYAKIQSNLVMFFRHGTAERVYRLEFVSNQPFTDSEFSMWRETMVASDLKVPSLRQVEKKAIALKEASAYCYKESDIDEVRYLLPSYVAFKLSP